MSTIRAALSAVLAVALTALAILLAPAAADAAPKWHPTKVALPTQVAADAEGAAWVLCYPAVATTPAARDWQGAFCTGHGRNAPARRLGWCFRWAASRPARISATCLRDITRDLPALVDQGTGQPRIRGLVLDVNRWYGAGVDPN